jgi:shikimate kinase
VIVFLTGFMGSGKTSMGKLLAEELNYPFIDLDKFIEERMLISIAKIFHHYGEYFFRKTESEYLHEMANWKNLVVACGGGTPCYDKNLDWMKSTGLTVYLKTTNEELYKRLAVPEQKNDRPLIASLTAPAMKTYIKETLKKRELYYNQADILLEQKNEIKKDVASLLVAVQNQIELLQTK